MRNKEEVRFFLREWLFLFWEDLKGTQTFLTAPVMYDMGVSFISLPLALILRLGEGIWELDGGPLFWNSISFVGVSIGVLLWTQRYKIHWEETSLIDFIGAGSTAFFCLILFVPYLALSGQLHDFPLTLLMIQFLILTNLWWVGRLVYYFCAHSSS